MNVSFRACALAARDHASFNLMLCLRYCDKIVGPQPATPINDPLSLDEKESQEVDTPEHLRLWTARKDQVPVIGWETPDPQELQQARNRGYLRAIQARDDLKTPLPQGLQIPQKPASLVELPNSQLPVVPVPEDVQPSVKQAHLPAPTPGPDISIIGQRIAHKPALLSLGQIDWLNAADGLLKEQATPLTSKQSSRSSSAELPHVALEGGQASAEMTIMQESSARYTTIQVPHSSAVFDSQAESLQRPPDRLSMTGECEFMPPSSPTEKVASAQYPDSDQESSGSVALQNEVSVVGIVGILESRPGTDQELSQSDEQTYEIIDIPDHPGSTTGESVSTLLDGSEIADQSPEVIVPIPEPTHDVMDSHVAPSNLEMQASHRHSDSLRSSRMGLAPSLVAAGLQEGSDKCSMDADEDSNSFVQETSCTASLAVESPMSLAAATFMQEDSQEITNPSTYAEAICKAASSSGSSVTSPMKSNNPGPELARLEQTSVTKQVKNDVVALEYGLDKESDGSDKESDSKSIQGASSLSSRSSATEQLSCDGASEIADIIEEEKEQVSIQHSSCPHLLHKQNSRSGTVWYTCYWWLIKFYEHTCRHLSHDWRDGLNAFLSFLSGPACPSPCYNLSSAESGHQYTVDKEAAYYLLSAYVCD